MITKLLQKQIQGELVLIYGNLYEFVKHFFGDEASENLDVIDIIIYMAPDFLYVQQHWTDEDGMACVYELDIDYTEYNRWFKEQGTTLH